jgi:hypothetical protein
MWLTIDTAFVLAQSTEVSGETRPDIVGLIGWATVIVIALVLIRQRRSKF